MKKHLFYIIFFLCIPSLIHSFSLEENFSAYSYAAPLLSPCGKYICHKGAQGNSSSLYLHTLETDEKKVILESAPSSYLWMYDNEHLLYSKDNSGDEHWKLYAYNIITGEHTVLIDNPKVQGKIVSLSHAKPYQVVIALNDSNPYAHDIYLFDIQTKEKNLIYENPGDIVSWCLDKQLSLCGFVKGNDDGSTELLWINQNKCFEQRAFWNVQESTLGAYLGCNKHHIFLKEYGKKNTASLVQLNIKNNKRKTLLYDECYDCDSLFLHPRTDRPLAAYIHTEAWHMHASKKSSCWIKNIIKCFGDDITIFSSDLDCKKIIIATHNEQPTNYYLYDTKHNSFNFLGSHKPKESVEYKEFKPFSFTSRDGILIHGYMIIPKNVTSLSKLPVIIDVHGGPSRRDMLSFDPIANLFASLGCLCVRINFRGSTGYGRNFFCLADKQWGGSMQNDLTDGVEWLIENNIADPEKIAIFGASYGGYAALAGACFTPDLYQCAIDLYGVSNIVRFLETAPSFWKVYLAQVYAHTGHPQKDFDLLYDRSPINHVDKIKIPLLIAQGSMDPRVKQEQSDYIATALKNRGIECNYLVFPDEGHMISKYKNKMVLWKEVKEFLEKHLKLK